MLGFMEPCHHIIDSRATIRDRLLNEKRNKPQEQDQSQHQSLMSKKELGE